MTITTASPAVTLAASLTEQAPPPRASRFERVVTDRVLAGGVAIMLTVVAAAMLRGHAQWGRIPWPVWAHLGTMTTALALTPVLLVRRKGTAAHRVLGWTWAIAMLATAGFSFLVRWSHPGHLSVIHVLSAWVLLQVPIIVWRARTHQVAAHRRSIRGIVIGALLIARFFTFPFDRLLGSWLFS